MSFKFKLSIFILFASFSLVAQVRHAPASFIVNGKKAVFVDFKEATYEIVFDSLEKTAKSTAIIQFESNEEGMPIFDLVENPISVSIDGKKVGQKLIESPDGDTAFRIIEETILPGIHSLRIESSINREVDFEFDSVSSAFWFSDFKDRSFLEAYLPTNLEFDQYKMIFAIDFKSFKNQKIYSNGKVSKQTDSKFIVEFPATYTSSSVYFHTDKVGKNIELPFDFHTTNKSVIPIMLYSLNSESDLKATKEKITEILVKLEKKFGPIPHPALTILDSGKREMAMEYSGALTFDPWTLQHELTHSYFARGGLMPANGNAGWIDEAISYWNDKDSPTLKDLGDLKSNLAGHSQYRRFTDHKAPLDGQKFMSFLHYKFQNKGGLVPFLNQLIKTEAWKPMTTNEFKDKMSTFYAEDLTDLFNKHLYSN
jgi:hypothetical protein